MNTLEELEMGARIAVNIVSKLGSRAHAMAWLDTWNPYLKSVPSRMIKHGYGVHVLAYLNGE